MDRPDVIKEPNTPTKQYGYEMDRHLVEESDPKRLLRDACTAHDIDVSFA